MKIYIVGNRGPEHNRIASAHKTHEGARKAWNELRRRLLQEAQAGLQRASQDSKEIYEEMVKNLSCEDPEKIDNYPQETPYINEIELEE